LAQVSRLSFVSAADTCFQLARHGPSGMALGLEFRCSRGSDVDGNSQKWFWEKLHDACAEHAVAMDWKLPNNIHNALCKTNPELFTQSKKRELELKVLLREAGASALSGNQVVNRARSDDEATRAVMPPSVPDPAQLAPSPPVGKPPVPCPGLMVSRSAGDLRRPVSIESSASTTPGGSSAASSSSGRRRPQRPRREADIEAGKLFNALDVNGDGSLSLQELSDGLARGAVQSGMARRGAGEKGLRLAPLALKPGSIPSIDARAGQQGPLAGKLLASSNSMPDFASDGSTRVGSAATSARSALSSVAGQPHSRVASKDHPLPHLGLRSMHC